MNKVKILVLAGGLGKRMNNPELPKVLIELKNRPLISYLLDAVKKSEIDFKPTIIVGNRAELVKNALGQNYEYVYQSEQLGTGHAVMCAKDQTKEQAENVLILYGDQPLLTSETLKNLVNSHLNKNAVITMGTVLVDDFNEWRAGFYDFGRIVRDQVSTVIGIVEKKDATTEQLAIKELNPSYFCFQASWLWENLKNIDNNNSQKEYYLTDLIKLAFKQNIKINTVNIKPKEAVGINNEEQLKLVEELMDN